MPEEIRLAGARRRYNVLVTMNLTTLYEPRELVGHLKDFRPLTFILVNGKPEEELWDEVVRTWHYLGYKKMIGPRVKYLVLTGDNPIAAISFNRASLHVGVRDKWLGWNEEGRRMLLCHVVSNNRFLICPWVHIKNLASHVLSQALRLLQTDWRRLYDIEPYAVETFIDFSRNKGTCYKAANWQYLGTTRGFGKVGNAFVYHGNHKGVFAYVLNRKIFHSIARYPRPPDPTIEARRVVDMMLSEPGWSPNLFAEVGLTEEAVAGLGQKLSEYMDYFRPCFSRMSQLRNAKLYIKGLLSNINRKNVERMTLKYQEGRAVRPMQEFQRAAPWDDAELKRLHIDRVVEKLGDPDGMMTIDGTDFPKKGKHSAGVAPQYCGRLGKTANCQASVFIGYTSKKGYALVTGRLYLPECWHEDGHQALREQCEIPGRVGFRTKPQLALDMLSELEKHHQLPYKWIGCDAAFGCDGGFRDSLPDGAYFFADIRSNQRIFPTRPKWLPQERKGTRGRAPTKLVPDVVAISASDVAADESIPWQEVIMAKGSKGPIRATIKYCRIIEYMDGYDGDELWLYIRKHENNELRYALSNAPGDIDVSELHTASSLRWPIEQCFQECKSELGMGQYETRSYIGWHRHMLFVMIAHLFVFEVRCLFQKKNDSGECVSILSMPQAKRIISTCLVAILCEQSMIKKIIRDAEYYQKNNAKSYKSYFRKRLYSYAS